MLLASTNHITQATSTQTSPETDMVTHAPKQTYFLPHDPNAHLSKILLITSKARNFRATNDSELWFCPQFNLSYFFLKKCLWLHFFFFFFLILAILALTRFSTISAKLQQNPADLPDVNIFLLLIHPTYQCFSFS